MLKKQHLINLAVAACVVIAVLAASFGFAQPSAAEAPEQPLYELLKSTGVDKLEVGKTYTVAGDLTVTLVSAVNGKGTQVDLELVKRTGTLLTDPSQKFTGIFAEKGTRTNMAPAAISETEDVHYVLAFNKQVNIPRAGDIDNDPKPNNNETGAFYIVNGQRFVVPISKPNVDNEVAFVQVDQVTDKIEYESDDSWHSIIMIRVPQTTTTPTPTPTSTPTTTSTPSVTATPVTATPVIPPATTVYTLYLALTMRFDAPPPPTSTPTATATPPPPTATPSPTRTPRPPREEPTPTATPVPPTEVPPPPTATPELPPPPPPPTNPPAAVEK